MSKSRRIGDFTVLSLTFKIGVAVLVAIAAVMWMYWKQSADGKLPWNEAYPVILVGGVVATGLLIWLALQIVWWVEIGPDLCYATTFGTHSIPWQEVAGIQFEIENQGMKLPIVPIKVVTNQRCHAIIILKNQRVLRGIVNGSEALLLQELMQQKPTLDTNLKHELSSPRSTMMMFVDSLDEGFVEKATRCIDFSLVPELESARAMECALNLKERLDEVWFISFDDMPDDPLTPSPYIIGSDDDHQTESDQRRRENTIEMTRDSATEMWRFSAQTALWVLDS